MKNQKLFGIIVLIVLLILVVGVAAYFITRDYSKKKRYAWGCEDNMCVKKRNGKYTNFAQCQEECGPHPPSMILSKIKESLMSACQGVGGDSSKMGQVLKKVNNFSDLRQYSWEITRQLNDCYGGPAQYKDAFNFVVSEILQLLINLDDKTYQAFYNCVTTTPFNYKFADLADCLEKANVSSQIIGAVKAVVLDTCAHGHGQFNRQASEQIAARFDEIKTLQQLAANAGYLEQALEVCYSPGEIQATVTAIANAIVYLCQNDVTDKDLCDKLKTCIKNQSGGVNVNLADFLQCLAMAFFS